MIMNTMKFSMLALMMALAGNASAAQFTVENFTIAANETKTISINLTNTETIYGYALWLKLPDGVTYSRTTGTSRTDGFSRDDNVEDGYLKISGASGKYPIKGTSGAILDVTIIASDQVATGPQTMEIVHQQIVLNNDQSNPVKQDLTSSSYVCTTLVNVTTAASGYGTFSWPRDLDFTDAGVEAYVATRDQDSWLHMEQVMKVPAHTGIVIKGSASTTYNPTVIDDATLTLTNVLSATDEGAVSVTTDGYYALATKSSKGTAFYEVDATKGVSIPKYKAYLIHSGSQGADDAVFMSLEAETDGISTVTLDEESAYYNLQGIRMENPSLPGVYIQNGKKKVIK